MLQQAWLDIYPGLANLEPEIAEIFAREVKVAELGAGEKAFHPGDPCRNWYMLLRGQVRVHQLLADGREIVVCRFFPGKTCIISALGIMANEPYSTEAVAETDIAALVLPADTFRHLLANSRSFREFVFSAYNTEVLSLMSIIEDVAFRRIDARLAACLLTRAERDQRVQSTHEDLAVELGTAREVVSRQLKTFEQRGWVRCARGVIDLLEPAALRQTADHQPAPA